MATGNPSMATTELAFLHEQLQQRRERLQQALAASPGAAPLAHLLAEVDSALERMARGTYGICPACNESVEKDRLLADPLTCYCLAHLTTEQQRALERDLELAAQIQRRLLPPADLRVNGWEAHYRYEPAGLVSGDYCDLIPDEKAGALFFVLGDVSGKGVAASMLMTHLNAIFRSLGGFGLPLDALVAHANRVFCDSALAGQYATMVCGRAGPGGDVELINAGHCPALLVRRGSVSVLDSTGVPLGMFCLGEFALRRVHLEPGDTLFLYTDGLSEARDSSSAEYGQARLQETVRQNAGREPRALADSCLRDARAFSGGQQLDDLALLVVRRASALGAV